MTAPEPPSQAKRLWVLAGLAPLAVTAPLHGQAQEHVIWEPVTEDQTDQLQILVPSVDGGINSFQTVPTDTSAAPQPIVWEVVPDKSDPTTSKPSPSTEVVWEPIPTNPLVTGDGSKNGPDTAIVWEVLPNNTPSRTPRPNNAIADIDNNPYGYEMDSLQEPPTEVIAQEQQMPERIVPRPPKPPSLQALDRSIAFKDGLVGPDIGFSVPNGFRWSERWFGNATIRGISRRTEGEDFFAWNDGDGDAQLHLNLLQTENWSFGLNSTVRSVYQGSQAAGGSSAVGEGTSMGFRIAKRVGDTGGIALGGEQIVQFDSFSDQGRNFYLVASKGWWLGEQGRDYPLLIANGGVASGRVALNSALQLGCIENVENRPRGSAGASVDNDVCFGLVGTLSLVLNEWWGVFLEYGQRHSFNASVNLTGGIPLRLTGGVVFAGLPYAEPNEFRDFDELTWIIKASVGF